MKRGEAKEGLGSPQSNGMGIRWGSGKPPPRPWQPVIQTIRELTVLPTTVLHRAKKMTKINTECVFVGEFPWTPLSLSFLISSFLFLSLFHFPFLSLFPLSIPSLFSNCKYCTGYALCSCKKTIIVTAPPLCSAHGKPYCYRPIFSVELCK